MHAKGGKSLGVNANVKLISIITCVDFALYTLVSFETLE